MLKRNEGYALSYVLVVLLVLCAIAITVIYPLLPNTPLGTSLELLSRLIFKKNFFSGRHIIWSRIEALILQSPFIGYGLDATPGMFYNTLFSSHNFWLQTSLQSGLIGMVIVVVLYLNAIYASYYPGSKEWYLVVSFGAAYMIHECFEVSLTQNNFCLGILVWFFLGFMIAQEKNRPQNPTQTV